VAYLQPHGDAEFWVAWGGVVVVARPFRALRYSADRVALERVLVPAKSTIDDDLRNSWFAMEPRNMSHVVYGLADHGEDEHAPLRRGRALLDDWLRAGVLVEDDEPVFYLLRQTFSVAGAEELQSRSGIFVGLCLDKDTVAHIAPHEQILPERAARVRQLRNVLQTQVEPVFLTYADPKRRVHKALRSLYDEEPDLQFTHEGVESELWIVDDETTIARIEAQLADAQLYIADGHHRMASFGHDLDDGQRQTAAAAFLVADTDPGLQVWPTHRVFDRDEVIDREALMERLVQDFDVESIDSDVSCRDPSNDHPCMVLASPQGRHRLTPKSIPDDLFAAGEDHEHYPHTALVERMFFKALQDIHDDVRMHYERDEALLLQRIDEGEGRELAVLVRPPRLDEVFALSDAGKTVSPKSTAFLPRLPIGICMARASTLLHDITDS